MQSIVGNNFIFKIVIPLMNLKKIVFIIVTKFLITIMTAIFKKNYIRFFNAQIRKKL